MLLITRKAAVLATVVLLVGAVASPAQSAESKSVTPSEVYSIVELTNRSLDALLNAKAIPAPAVQSLIETGLGPFHAYQLYVACVESLHQIQKRLGIPPIPLVTSSPMKYTPGDVNKLGAMLLSEVRGTAEAMGVEGLPEDLKSFSNKTPTDVFDEIVSTFTRLRALEGRSAITSNEVYAETVRAVGDAKSILGQIDPASRYRINAPVSDQNLDPRDVYAKCLKVRASINVLRESFGLGSTPVPRASRDRQLSPEDVFVQTQILIAEMNLIKIGTNTVSATAIAIPAHGMKPGDVHQQVVLLQYLLEQVTPLQQMVAALKN